MERVSVVVSSTTVEAAGSSVLGGGSASNSSANVTNSGSSGIGIGDVGSVDPGDPGTFTAYVVEVQVGAAVWAVKRRYKQFRDVADALALAFPTQALPPFPPKKFLRHTADDAEERRQAFQAYLQAIVAVPVLRTSWHIQHFLELRAHLGGGPKRRILCPLPRRDFDPAELGVAWHVLKRCEGFEIVFATPDGQPAEADPRMLEPLSVGERRLAAEWEPKLHFRSLIESDENFSHPLRYADVVPSEFDGLLLLGGLSSAMREYAEDIDLQAKVAEFWKLDRPVAAIDHGLLVLANSTDADTGKSVIADRRVAVLTKRMQQAAYTLTRFGHGEPYRSYPDTWLQHQVVAVMNDPSMVRVETTARRGTAYVDTSAFVLTDRNLVTARWQGDAYLLARTFAHKLLDDIETGVQERRHSENIPAGAGGEEADRIGDDSPYGSL